jgi:hypothetical protein
MFEPYLVYVRDGELVWEPIRPEEFYVSNDIRSGLVLGGPGHGQYLDTWRRYPGELARWPAPMSIGPPDFGNVSLDRMTFQACDYRLCLFGGCGEVFKIWIPANVPREEELIHILKLALGGSVF